jgi:hypothetical protein
MFSILRASTDIDQPTSTPCLFTPDPSRHRVHAGACAGSRSTGVIARESHRAPSEMPEAVLAHRRRLPRPDLCNAIEYARDRQVMSDTALVEAHTISLNYLCFLLRRTASPPPRPPLCVEEFLHTSNLHLTSYLFRPYFSWLDTQSDDEIAAASEISPASATPATISASLLTWPLPTQPSISRHSR